MIADTGALRIGLVDAVVVAMAERLRAPAIAALDLGHFGAIAIEGRPRLIPRDTQAPAASGLREQRL